MNAADVHAALDLLAAARVDGRVAKASAFADNGPGPKRPPSSNGTHIERTEPVAHDERPRTHRRDPALQHA